MKTFRVPLHDNGPALWPDYIDLQALESARRESGTPIFNTMYQGEPGGLKGQIISRDFFRYIGSGALERAFIAESQTIAALDPAISEKSSADETALAVGSIHPNGMTYVRFVWHGRVGVIEQERVLVEAHRYYKPVEMLIESQAYQVALVQIVAERHPELPLTPVTQTKDKFSRFLAMGAAYEFGRVLHHPSLEASAAENQLTKIPAARHDDIADAIAMLTAYAESGAGAAMIERPKGFR